MNSPDDNNNELRRRERELQERENAIRLREIEAELHSKEPPLHKTVRHQPKGSLKTWQRKLVIAGKFFVLAVATIVCVKVASWIAGFVIVGGLAWFSYKLFFQSEIHNR